MRKTSNLVCRALLVLLGVFLATLPTQAKVYDFENESDNAHWHFVNDYQINKWIIGTSAGSNGIGSSALYVSGLSSGTEYSYDNIASTVWAYCDEVLTGDAIISFDWKGVGEGSYDYMYAYLIPINATRPTSGSTTVSSSAIQIGSRFNGQSSWTTFTDGTRTLTEQYYLYFMWRNDGSLANSPIAIDNVAFTPLLSDSLFIYGNISDTTLSIIEYIGTESDVVIPTSYNNLPIITISNGAFRNKTFITSITIPASVTSIGSSVFSDCSGLTSIICEDGNTIYDSRNNCNALIETATNTLILGCKNTIVPESVTSIGERAFSGCSGLTSITIPENVTSIGDYAFQYCSGLTSVIWNAKNCNSFSSYSIAPFYDISSQITSFTFGDDVEHIPAYLCYGMSGLTSVTIPDSTTSIGSYAFSGCGITNIRFHENLTSIGSYILQDCPLEYIIALKEAPVSIMDNLIGSDKSTQNIPLFVPQSSVAQYQAATYWKGYDIKSQGFTIHTTTTQATASVSAVHIALDSIGHDRLGYVFAGDTIWNNDTSSDSISFTITGLAPSTDYEFCLVADGVLTNEEMKVVSDPCDRSQWSAWSTPNNYWTSYSQYYSLYGSSGTYKYDCLYRTVTLEAGVEYTFSMDAYRNSYSGLSLTMSIISDGGQYTTLLDVSSLTTSATTYSATFTPTETKEYLLELYGYVVRFGEVYVKNISVTRAPWKVGMYSQCFSFQTQAVKFNVSAKTTQTTARVSLGIDCGDVPAIEQCGFIYYKSDQSNVVDTIFFASNEPVATLDTLLTGLSINTEYYAMPFVDIDSVRYFRPTYLWFTTKDVSISLTCGTTTESTIPVTFTYNLGDADALNAGNGIEYCEGYSFGDNSTIYTFSIDSASFSLSLDTLISGLTPGTRYTFRPYVEIESVGRLYGATETVSMKSISISASLVDRTQTTVSMHFSYRLGDANVNYIYCTFGDKAFRIYPTETSGALDTTFTQLHAGTSYTFSAYARLTNDVTCGNTSKTFTTLPVVVNAPSISEYGQTYAVVNSSCDYGDAMILRNVLEFKRSSSEDAAMDTTLNITDTQTKVTNLFPDTTYYYRHLLEIGTETSVYDFSYAPNNTHWHFINGTESNQWVIGQGAGGGTSLYISSNGTSYSYTNTRSTVWAYCDDVLSGTVKISFVWSGMGKSVYDYMSVYLIPVSAEQPIAGRTRVPSGAIQIGSYLSGQSSWTTFTDEERTLTESYHLYFMWNNMYSTASRSPIAIDDVNTNVQHITSEGTLTSEWQEMMTKEITLSTQTPDGISNTSALLHGTIDCDQESYTEVGFEWKRSDAPATVQPQRLLVTDRVDENLLFRLEGLSGDRYYDYRTFCSYLGETYYGEWVGFLTADKEVLVAPTVQTVGAEITEQGVEMEGFVVAGTEPMLQQGFEVWVKGTTNVLTTVAEGTIMHAYIPELRSYTTYQYRAYAKTAAGTTYGATLEIETGYIKQNVQDVTVTPSATEATITWTVVEDAAYYLLTLFADEAQTDTVGVYEVGTDGVITRRNKPGAVQSLVNCLVEELEPDTEYFFSVVAYNATDQKVAEETGWFATELPTSLVFTTDEENGVSAPIVRKILYRGQVLILRDGKVYNLFGQEVR